jgi:hypothetical protein
MVLLPTEYLNRERFLQRIYALQSGEERIAKGEQQAANKKRHGPKDRA